MITAGDEVAIPVEGAMAFPSKEAMAEMILANDRTEKKALHGLRFTRRDDQERVILRMETPLIDDAYIRPVWLPGDLALFSLGNRVYLLNLMTMEVGFLTPGRSPVVVLDSEEE